MELRGGALVAVILCTVIAPAAMAQLLVETSPSKILRHPDRYNEQPVRLGGTLTQGRTWISPRGRRRFIFYVSDSRTAIAVVAPGERPCPDGSRVTVEGVFHRQIGVDGRLVYNHIDAQLVSCAEPPASRVPSKAR